MNAENAKQIFWNSLEGAGEMAERTRSFDWSQTPLGSIDSWPQSLKTIVSTMLRSRYAMWLGWGPQLTFFYNDAYATMTLGPRHPWALGRSASEVWSEIWSVIGPRAESVMRTGTATWDEGLLLFLERRGFPEETYHTFSYSPVPDDMGGIGGMLCVVTEDTERTVGERRLRTLRELAAQSNDDMRSAEEACESAARILSRNPYDVPLVLLYLLERTGRVAKLAGAGGIVPESPASPTLVSLGSPEVSWPFQQVIDTGRAVDVSGLSATFGELQCGPWPEPLEQAVVLPMSKASQTQPAGFVVVGISRRRLLDDDYRGFCELLAGQIATTVANARAYDEERQRAAALAELDRAKTAFFSNVSHEFRTPLTLMLGPVQDLLSTVGAVDSGTVQSQLELVNRNGQRLLRLVNSLLDFSRIEAGRVKAIYHATDLAEFTADLASVFRAACERAGLRLTVDCRSLSEPAYVDREMWEKIVLNLLSNAFKFTLDGEISVRLRQVGAAAELSIRDTGIGIAADQMPRLFERFHRIEDARGRTHEGSGIGLALVQELVKLHGGTVTAESAVGLGTTFLVTVPLGPAHLPPDRLGDGRVLAAIGPGSVPFVEEALRWLPDPPRSPYQSADHANSTDAFVAPLKSAPPGDRPSVLVAEDNADMRQYMIRLLADRFQVEAVADGEAALASIADHLPELVLTDVMMPRLDGFGLLQKLRADPRTSSLPVIMLSARAGEESRIEGMEAGADDYLVKPFSARELLASVSGHVQMARLRREMQRKVRQSEERFRAFVTASSDIVFRMNSDWSEMQYLVGREFVQDTSEPSRTWLERYFPPDDQPYVLETIQNVIRTRSVFQLEHRIVRVDGSLGWTFTRALPLLNEQGEIVEWIGAAIDITARKAAEESIQRERDLLRVTLGSIADAVITTDRSGLVANMNSVAETLTGWSHRDAVGQPLDQVFRIISEETRQPFETPAVRALRDGVIVAPDNHTLLVTRTGREHPIDHNAAPIRNDRGEVIGCVLVFRDITDRKQVETALRETRSRLVSTLAAGEVGTWEFDVLQNTVQADPNLARMFHVNPRDAEGGPLDVYLQAIHPEDRGRVIASISEALEADETFEADYRLISRTGDVRWVVARGRVERDETGRGVRLPGVVVDITGQRQAERELRDSEERWRLALDSAELGAWNIDPVNFSLTTDERFRRIFHGTEAPITYEQAIATIHPEDRALVRASVSAALNPVEPTQYEVEHRVIHPDGSIHWVLAKGRTNIGRQGQEFKVTSFDGTVADITQRKEAEEALRKVAADLSEADRRKTEFLATLGHELRNPLAPIRTGLELMKMLKNDPVALEATRSMMERQARQLVRLIDDLLDVSRITQGKLQLRTCRTTLGDVVRSAVEAARPFVDEARHQLQVALPEQPVYLEADPNRLAQVFSNLLNNATKYTPEQGQIELRAERDRDVVVIAVKDNGIGIPADMHSTIFEMFAQIDRPLEKGYKGLGIGLTLVKRLVEMHGGTVSVVSQGENQGSEFRVRLPILSPATDDDQLADSTDSAGVPSRLRILVVDDNQVAADTLGKVIQLLGNEVRTAYDGVQGVKAADEFRPEIILMDLGMPRMNGYEAARSIRKQTWGQNIMLVALTGWGQDDDRQRTKDAGFNHHLVKPAEPAALQKLFQEFVLTRD